VEDNQMKSKIKIFTSITTLITLAFIIIALTSGCLADPTTPLYSSTGEKDDQLSNTITVTGEGSYIVVPDEAKINISVFIEEETSQEAVDKNGKTTADVIAALEGLDIQDMDIQTVSFNLDPLYNYRRENEPPEVYAYRATTVIEVSTLDMTMVGEIISEAIDAGANDVSSLRFGLSDELERQAKKEALDRAAKDGRDKASDIAESLGIDIVSIYYISESATSIPIPFETRAFAAEEVLGDAMAVPITPNEIEVTAAVKISYIFR
jgi:uncharacterized protein YggE